LSELRPQRNGLRRESNDGFAGQTNTQIAADYLTAFGNNGGVQGNT